MVCGSGKPPSEATKTVEDKASNDAELSSKAQLSGKPLVRSAMGGDAGVALATSIRHLRIET
jgi:hypothetical protein